MSDQLFIDDTECLDVTVLTDGADDSGNYKFICRLEHTGHQSYAQSFGVYFSTEVSVVEVPGDMQAEANGNHVQFRRNNQMNDNGLVDVWIKLAADTQPQVTGITDITCHPDPDGCAVPVSVPEKAPLPVAGPVQKAILSRRSTRNYKPDMIPREVLDQILQAGTYAATGMNRQSPVILAVTRKDMRDKLSAMNAQIMGTPGTDPFYGAPVVLAVLADKNAPTFIYDGSLVIGNMMLAADELGIASCWVHRAKEAFESKEGKEILKSLGIEGDYEGIGHLILGYAAADRQEAPPRKEHYVYYID